MFTVLSDNGVFLGVTYPELTEDIKKYHAQYGQDFLEIEQAPVDTIPMSPDLEAIHIADYGVPTNEQLRVGMRWKHIAFLKSTDWYVLRKMETNELIPTEILTKRAEARAALRR